MSHTGAPGLVHHPISTYTASSEPPSVITRYSTLAPDAMYARSREETSLTSFGLALFAGYGPTVLRDTPPYYLLKSYTFASVHTTLVGRESPAVC